jgi:hypothetical protein
VTIGSGSSAVLLLGNVGIGTTTPSSELTVSDGTTPDPAVLFTGGNVFMNSAESTTTGNLGLLYDYASDGGGGTAIYGVSLERNPGGDNLIQGVEGDAYTGFDGGQSAGLVGLAGADGNIKAGLLQAVYAYLPFLSNGATASTAVEFWSDDLGQVSGVSNLYYSWFDSRGVRRVKEDSTVDGVGQAIEALYNNLFTKYTPGATNYERVILGEWNNNVAEIGTEAGGTGTLRPLLLMGSQIGIGTGTSVPSTTFQVAGASSTIRIGTASLPGCLEMGNSNGSAGINYVTFLNGVMTATTTKPNACQ